MINAMASEQAGWCYSSAGTPCAYVMPLDEPERACMVPCETWWQAMRFALSFSENNGCEYVGGPNE